MPLFEFRCEECRRRFTLLVGVVAASSARQCPRCGSERVRKLISRFAVARSEDDLLDSMADPASMVDGAVVGAGAEVGVAVRSGLWPGPAFARSQIGPRIFPRMLMGRSFQCRGRKGASAREVPHPPSSSETPRVER